MKTPEIISTSEYSKTLAELKKEIREAQVKAVIAANQELINLYWKIGKIVVERQEASGWGSSLIDKLTEDLQKEFPGIAGFSRSNVFRMRAFYLEYSKVAPPVRQFTELENLNVLTQIPWSHNIVLMEKLKNLDERIWYAYKIIENGWSRNVLAMQIDSNLYQRQGKAITNFSYTLADPQSDLAQQSLKDPYIFDFLTLHDKYTERDIEQSLVDNVQKFLLELGKGFAFIGRQYHLSVNNRDYYIDLF